MADVKATDEQNYPQMWEHRWDSKNTAWDQGKVHPALAAFLESQAAVDAGIPTTGRAFVPGCGQGYDVDLFARRGLDTTGLDVAPTGAKSADAWVKAQTGQKGRAEVVCGDFFKWTPEEKFDLIYDYTFLCALPPTLRPQWGQRMTELSKASPNSRLITLQYPLQGNPPPFGPPFALDESVYRDVLGDHWEAIYDEPVPEEQKRKNRPPGNERLVVWKRK
ncbi:Thiopurine S-methyltransferase [Cutaneotrichosporon oleaginosum]|uniref:Thiopurine S-methyltransferase n=1 Tax=Cutaneotrichosporon oleaginosum TaxID=879819 RepID=A0A0J0XL46_9TREE|nr:Thiopurine S-methyltransferase [Cutaneotrichosporon oleaginosum]KLT41795.1 Thiopurine S-methyltransferase [Cutaneotrichosporon oleaginosum]TXT12390.1 hypothetical protein COLE_02800 [Cutaneotrichosporon oleaginosum]